MLGIRLDLHMHYIFLIFAVTMNNSLSVMPLGFFIEVYGDKEH